MRLLLSFFLVTLLTVFSSPFAFSQTFDTLQEPTATDTLKKQTANDSLPKQIPKQVSCAYGMDDALQTRYPIDTGLAEFHYYDPVDQQDFLYRNTGALGSASFRLVCCEDQLMGIRMGYDQFNLYKFTKYNVPFYKNTRPFSQLNFLIGLKKEQTFKVTHSQNIGKKFNLGFHYLRYATRGAYVNQDTKHNDIAFTTRFDNKKRYFLQTILIFNNNRPQENGGVKETTIYKDTSFVSKELVNVELESAENKHREISFHVRHAFKSGATLEIPPADSTHTQIAILPVRPSWEIYQELEVGREQYDYTDNRTDSSYSYYGLFLPEDSTVSDLQYDAQKVFTGTSLGFKKSVKQKFIIDASSTYTFNIVAQDSFPERHFNYLDAKLSLTSDTGQRILYGASATYSFMDYNKADLKSNAYVGYQFPKAGTVQLGASYSRIEPSLIFSTFSFGKRYWENDFDKQSLFMAELSYRLPKYHLQAAVRFNQYDDLAFWAANRMPAQHHGTLNTWVFEVHKLFRINYFGFDNVLRVQLVSDKNFLRYPVYWGVHSLFYERGVFKGKLLTRVGIDIRYNTNYAAPGYFPLTGQFYLQDEEQLTFYPVLDLYFCFKIKTARIFLKVQHLNQGMFKDKGYFNAYKYPATDRTFRFGISWMFLD